MENDDKIDRIATQYTSRYPWADHQAIRMFFRLELVADSLHAAARRMHSSILSGHKAWSVAVLRALYLTPGQRLSHAEIGNETRVPPANVTYQVDVLERDGLVVRVPHASDRRITMVELTPLGESFCDKLLPARAELITELGSEFTEDEKVLFNQFLERLHRRAEASGYGSD